MKLQAELARQAAAEKEEEENSLIECPICCDEHPLPQMYFVCLMSLIQLMAAHSSSIYGVSDGGVLPQVLRGLYENASGCSGKGGSLC